MVMASHLEHTTHHVCPSKYMYTSVLTYGSTEMTVADCVK